MVTVAGKNKRFDYPDQYKKYKSQKLRIENPLNRRDYNLLIQETRIETLIGMKKRIDEKTV